VTVLLVIVAVGFAFSMGAHYTGACMGMPHALGAVTAWQALAIMAPLAFAGAALASHGVEHTVGHGLVTGRLTVPAQVIAVGVAFALTTLFNVLRVPTSTIQILVFTVAGVALAARTGVQWGTVGILAAVWAAAPPAAALLGFLLTRALDLVPALRHQPPAREPGPAGTGAPDTAGAGEAVARTGLWLGTALAAVGAAASFTMGANDVANATGSLVGTGAFTPLAAGTVGGLGLAAGVLTWGRPLLEKVAFDIVAVDRPMAAAAQLVQALVVLAAVAFGFFTSMNQALVGAMTGAGLARGRHTVKASSLYGILRGWAVGPGAGIAAGYLITLAVGLTGTALATP
jgi:PiT family inorganic phosphate transporter